MKKESSETEASKEQGLERFIEGKDDSLIFRFHQIHNAMFRLANKMIEASSVPIKMEQIPVLMTLFWLKEQSQQQVADRIHRDKSSVLRTVQVLEKKGLIINKKDEKDGRRKVLTLTETGKYIALQVDELAKEIENKIIGALTDRPRKEFLDLLKETTQKLEEISNS